MFEGVCLHDGYFLVPFVSAIALGGAAAVHIDRFFVDFGINGIHF